MTSASAARCKEQHHVRQVVQRATRHNIVVASVAKVIVLLFSQENPPFPVDVHNLLKVNNLLTLYVDTYKHTRKFYCEVYVSKYELRKYDLAFAISLYSKIDKERTTLNQQYASAAKKI